MKSHFQMQPPCFRGRAASSMAMLLTIRNAIGSQNSKMAANQTNKTQNFAQRAGNLDFLLHIVSDLIRKNTMVNLTPKTWYLHFYLFLVSLSTSWVTRIYLLNVEFRFPWVRRFLALTTECSLEKYKLFVYWVFLLSGLWAEHGSSSVCWYIL